MRTGLGTLALAVLVSGAAQAQYVRAHVSQPGPSGDHCLYWPAGALGFHQNSAGNPQTTDPFGAVSRSIQTWASASSGCGNLALSEGAQTGSRFIGYQADGGNENVILFRERLCSQVVPSGDPCLASGSCGNAYDCWPQENGDQVLALTTTTYDQDTGVLLDADVELNAGAFYFTTADSPVCATGVNSQTCVAFDVQNTATHELGHALGLAHSPDPASTMYAMAPRGQTSKRVLDADSQAFVCDTYPKGAASRDCVAPADGGTGQANGGRGCAAGGGEGGGTLALLAVGLLLWRARP